MRVCALSAVLVPLTRVLPLGLALVNSPSGGSLHIAWAKESQQEAAILHEAAEVASDLALIVPDGILQHGEGAGEEDRASAVSGLVTGLPSVT